jgi:hypothetical protein
VKKTLINFGIDTSDPIEMQKDFAYLRAWRLGADEVKTKGVLAILGMMLVGMVGALWVGFKSNLH